MKNREVPGIDVITAEVLKAGGDPMVAMLHKIFNTVYDTEKNANGLDADDGNPAISKTGQANARELSRNITSLNPWQSF